MSGGKPLFPSESGAAMTENESADQQGEGEGITSPAAPHPGEATKPPSNPEADDQAVEEGQERLDQAGGGH
jgi:hypothetical protein